MDPVGDHSLHARLREGVAWLIEGAFVVDVLLAGLVAAIVLLGGINPLQSLALTIGFAATVAIVGVHTYWMSRHRKVMVDQHARLSERERRGW